MARTKETIAGGPEELTGRHHKNESEGEPETVEAPKVAPKAPTPKRAPGTKEVIPFQWKLVGESDGLALTLFKAVEREEVEAQLDRLQKDNYYTKLRILDINAVVKQSSSAKARAVRKAAKAVKSKRAAEKPKGRKSKGSPSSKAAKARKAAPKTGAARTTKTNKPDRKKSARKTAKKSAAGSKSSKKRRTRKTKPSK